MALITIVQNKFMTKHDHKINLQTYPLLLRIFNHFVVFVNNKLMNLILIKYFRIVVTNFNNFVESSIIIKSIKRCIIQNIVCNNI